MAFPEATQIIDQELSAVNFSYPRVDVDKCIEIKFEAWTTSAGRGQQSQDDRGQPRTPPQSWSSAGERAFLKYIYSYRDI